MRAIPYPQVRAPKCGRIIAFIRTKISGLLESGLETEKRGVNSMRWLLVMTLFVPISIILKLTHASEALVFSTSALAIVPLAGFMGAATEEVCRQRGAGASGLLNATFGNATELIIGIVAVRSGQIEVVRASLIGS